MFSATVNQYGFVGFMKDTDLGPDVVGIGMDKGAY
jgi:hypothetical protein